MATSSALDAVMNAATAAADAAPAADNNTALVTQTQAAPPATTRPSLDAMADNSGITVDAYLSVKETGLRIDKNPVFQKAKGSINIADCVPIFSVRANRGGSTTFIKSYDGRSSSQGENWAQAIQRLSAQNDKIDGPYQTVEIPFVLGEDVPGATAGQTLGITPAITGVKFWTKFYKELQRLGLTADTVSVEVECVPQTNKNGNEWGVVGFKLLSDEAVA